MDVFQASGLVGLAPTDNDRPDDLFMEKMKKDGVID